MRVLMTVPRGHEPVQTDPTVFSNRRMSLGKSMEGGGGKLLRGWILRKCSSHGLPAGSRNCSNSLLFACCMRWAASVSLRAAAMRFRAVTLSPGRRYCAGLWSASSVSSGV